METVAPASAATAMADLRIIFIACSWFAGLPDDAMPSDAP
jgi:hypothetical protein